MKLSRLEAFSDGVLAIVATLLILEIRLPEHLGSDSEVWFGLRHLVPAFAAWIASFAFVATFWISHHTFLDDLVKADRRLLWLNALFLMFITMLPFATGLVGELYALTAPVTLMSCIMLLTSLSFVAMRFYAYRGGLSHRGRLSRGEMAAAMSHSALAPLLYAVAVAASLVSSPAALAIQFVVVILFVWRSPRLSQESVEPES